MSNLDAVRTELHRSGTPRMQNLAAVAVLLLAVGAGLAEIHLLPTFSADEVTSILFGAG